MPMATKELQREYTRKWVAARRAAFFKDKSCVKCGSIERLELDHIDPKQKRRKSDHALWSWTEHKRNEEIAKCQVLCHKCHLEKTKTDGVYLVGEKNPHSLLPKKDIEYIRLNYESHGKNGNSGRALAKKFGVSFKYISAIVNNRSRVKEFETGNTVV
jgi:hypothetical protein